MLQAIAAVLQSGIRKSDMVARIGGEEFVLLLPQSNLMQTQQIAEKIRGNIAGRAIPTTKGAINITMSFGTAICEQYVHFNQSLIAADEALYQAKANGRNRVC